MYVHVYILHYLYYIRYFIRSQPNNFLSKEEGDQPHHQHLSLWPSFCFGPKERDATERKKKVFFFYSLFLPR